MPHGNKNLSYCTNRSWSGRANCAHCSVRSLMLFSRLPPESFEHLLQPIDHELHQTGSLLYQEGASGKDVFSIRQGLVKLVKSSADGSERVVRMLGRGAVIGLELFQRNGLYKHSAIAVQDLDVCRIPMVTLQDLDRHYPELCNDVRKELQMHIDRADHWIRHLNTGKARSRIAELILLLVDIAADRNGDVELVSRDDMASIVGVTKETASRVIAEFKRHKLIYKVAVNRYRVSADQLRDLIIRESQADSDG